MSDRKRRRLPDAGRQQKDRYQLRSPLSILPSLFTIGNIFCAYYSVMATLNQKYDHAALAIGVGYILDGLDGRVARLTGTSTEFGAQLDSLADVLTFGIAPALLAFDWGIEWMSGSHSRSRASRPRGSWSPAPPASPGRWRRRSCGITRAWSWPR